MEDNIGKDVLGHYVDNIDEFKKYIGEDNKKKIKSEEFNKLMVYVPIHFQFGPIAISQFVKLICKPIFNEKSPIPQGLNIRSRYNEKLLAR